jgi:hypothetical protein
MGENGFCLETGISQQYMKKGEDAMSSPFFIRWQDPQVFAIACFILSRDVTAMDRFLDRAHGSCGTTP